MRLVLGEYVKRLSGPFPYAIPRFSLFPFFALTASASRTPETADVRFPGSALTLPTSGGTRGQPTTRTLGMTRPPLTGC